MSKYLLRFFARRLLVLVPILVGVTFVTFLLIRMGDVNPAVLIAGPRASPEEIESIEQDLHLDRPLLVQYGLYMGDLFKGDWGDSWVTKQSVLSELRTRLPVTIELVALGTAGALLFGIVVGAAAAVRPGRGLDRVTRVVTLLGISAPVFWLALLFLLVFAFRFELAPPPLGRLPIGESPPTRVTGAYLTDSVLTANWHTAVLSAKQIVLPVATITVVQGAVIAKHVRSSVIQTMSSDGFRLVVSQGYTRWEQVRYIARSTAASVISYLAIVFTALLGASALVELVFGWGGISQFGIDAIRDADFAIVQAYVLSMAVTTAIVFLMADVLVYMIDPRARRGVTT